MSSVGGSAYILGIESSCDDTAAAVVGEKYEVLSSVVASQMDLHSRFGGVVPEIASRVHVCEVVPAVKRAMTEAGISPRQLCAIAVTQGPGLAGSLAVGVSAAKALGLGWGVPVVPVNHLQGHLASLYLEGLEVQLPSLVLLVSGGHTLLAEHTRRGTYRVLGQTRDDSVGEAYDKVARLLDLGYPGGPILDRLAQEGEAVLALPRPMIRKGLEFSFSGLKSAVATAVRARGDLRPADVAASFVAAVMDVLVEKLRRALEQGDYKSVAVVGGVAASPILRDRVAKLGATLNIEVRLPRQRYSTDNAAMIAAAAWSARETSVLPSPAGLGFGIRPGLGLDGDRAE